MLLQEPACTTISEPMRWQERGDVGGSISAQVEELRMDASSKGRTWLQEKMASMTRDDLQKVAAASDVSTRRQDGSKVALAELRNALVEHFARRRVCWGEMFGFVKSSFQFLTVSLGSITESVWGVV